MSSVHGIFAITAMAALLLALKLHKSIPPPSPTAVFRPRPCISSGARKVEKEKKKKVRFAKDVVDPKGNNEEFRRHGRTVSAAVSGSGKVGMPANRVALYNGMMRDRMIHRLGCSY